MAERSKLTLFLFARRKKEEEEQEIKKHLAADCDEWLKRTFKKHRELLKEHYLDAMLIAYQQGFMDGKEVGEKEKHEEKEEKENV